MSYFARSPEFSLFAIKRRQTRAKQPRPALRRRAFSLIEIMVAMAICLLGLAAILQMSNLSQTFARKASDAAELQILCQNRINEVLAGLVPLEPVSEGICPENTEVGFSLNLEPHDQLPLVLLEVSVRPLERDLERSSSLKAPPPKTQTRRREQRDRQVTLRRWLALPSGQALPTFADSPAREPSLPGAPGFPPPGSNAEDDNE